MKNSIIFFKFEIQIYILTNEDYMYFFLTFQELTQQFIQN